MGAKKTYIIQLNCHICEGLPNWNEKKKGHIQSGNSCIGLPIFLKRRKISARLAAVQKLKFIIIIHQGQFARDVKEWLTIAVSIAAPYQLFLSRQLNEMWKC